MKTLRFGFLSILALLMLLPAAVQAGQVVQNLEILSFSVTCTSATVTYINNGETSFGNDFAYLELRKLGEEPQTAALFRAVPGYTILGIKDDEGSPWGDTVTFTFPEQKTGDILEIVVEVGPLQATARAIVPACGEDAELLEKSACADGRINFIACEPVAIYPVQDDGGWAMNVWIVERGDPIGRPGFFVSAEDLAALLANPPAPILVAESEDGFTQLYWLPSNEYQVNAGPDYEGKVFAFRFKSFPGQLPTLTTSR